MLAVGPGRVAIVNSGVGCIPACRAESEMVERPLNVLVPFASPLTRSTSKGAADSGLYNFIWDDAYNVGSCYFTNGQRDMLAYVDKCKARGDVDIVLSMTEPATVVHAALVQEFPHLRGPSVESVFLCMNKYYTQKVLDPDPIPHEGLDLDSPHLEEDAVRVAQEIGLPAIVKPASSLRSTGVKKVNTVEELLQAACDLRKFGTQVVMREVFDSSLMRHYVEKYVDLKKYPLATHNMAVVERYIQGELFTVDGCVYDGEIVHWAICDNLYFRSRPDCILGFANPSSLSCETQARLWQAYDKVLNRMIRHGFDNQEAHLEFFLMKDGDIKLLEINACMSLTLAQLYSHCLPGGDSVRLQLDLLRGVRPTLPCPSGRYSLVGYIQTFASGKAKELVDFDAVSRVIADGLGNVRIIVDPERDIVQAGDSGNILGKVTVQGDGFEDAFEKYKTICLQLLRKPELSPWE
ncbi:Hypp2948 [Branchiostoma lanceolatum]|uniref:Hypp2948 protein n=1 Tax=Branchiostoma lanceolatum TaxID=7740 RepID=A0A8K0ES69_BRALA|nr:Hypp2948 [Branchiostoma lanceolatum]